jgi:hypothetical protein
MTYLPCHILKTHHGCSFLTSRGFHPFPFSVVFAPRARNVLRIITKKRYCSFLLSSYSIVITSNLNSTAETWLPNKNNQKKNSEAKKNSKRALQCERSAESQNHKKEKEPFKQKKAITQTKDT